MSIVMATVRLNPEENRISQQNPVGKQPEISHADAFQPLMNMKHQFLGCFA